MTTLYRFWMICHSHTPFHLSLDLINALNLSISQSPNVLTVAVSIRQLAIICSLLVGLNLSDLFFLQYSTHDIFVSFTESCITSLYLRVFGILFTFDWLCGYFFFLWIFFSQSSKSGITSLYLRVLGILFAFNWLHQYIFPTIFFFQMHFFFLM